jgi:hypothetical protein
MSIKTGKVGSVFAIMDSTPFTTEATTEDGSTMIYQIDDAGLRIWDINTAVVISTGALDKSYFDNGVNYFEGKVKLLTSGETGLTVSGASLTLNEVAKAFGWALNMAIEAGDCTSLGEEWNTFISLGKGATVDISRFRTDQRFNLIENGFQECGLTGKTITTATGLSTTTQYFFKANIDGAGVVEEDFTTGSDVTYEAVLVLLNATLAAGAKFELVNGDLRCTSDTTGTSSTVALSAGTTGTDLFVTLTGFTAFNTAAAGFLNTKLFLLKLFEDGSAGYICNAIRTGFTQDKSVGSLDQESTTFEVTSQLARF